MSDELLANDLGRFRRSFKKLVERSGAKGHLAGPVRARTTQFDAEANTIAAQPLTADGQDDPRRAEIADIEVGSRFASQSGDIGLFVKIHPGAIVRIGFYDLDPSRPYLDEVIAQSIPDTKGAELFINAGGATIEVQSDSVTITGGAVTLSGGDVKMEASSGAFVSGLEIYLDGQVHAGGQGGANAQMALLGTSLLTWLRAMTVGGQPPDNLAALTDELMLAKKVSVE